MGRRKFVGHGLPPVVNRPSRVADGVSGAAWRISEAEEDDEVDLQNLSIPTSFATKQVAVAAFHAAHGVPDQTDDLRTGSRGQPIRARLLSNRFIEQLRRYFRRGLLKLPLTI